MRDEVRTFKVSKLAEALLDVDELLKDAKCEFDSQKWIRSITQEKILVLHAEDDGTVPYELGEIF